MGAPEGMATAPGDSAEQREAEGLILAAASRIVGAPLMTRQLVLGDGIRVAVDGMSDDPPVLVEAWAHQGRPKPAQKAKVLSDALKLLWVERVVFPAGARKILALADPDAAAPFLGGSWMAAALRDLRVEVAVVPLPAGVRARIRQAQARQVR